jgi:2-polyprenyl-3-methyl-5-hydroxy-6-metoxy-1,4-benzoquinol methylase
MYRNSDINYLKFLKGKKVIIFGAGKRGEKGFHSLSKEGINILCFCDNDKNKQGQLICGTKVISFEELCAMEKHNCLIIICSSFEREIKEQLSCEEIYNVISISQIDFGGGEEYYDEQYFQYQEKMGEFGGELSADFFRPYIKKDMTVIEFGSGGGYLLEKIQAKDKVGIEINDSARIRAENKGINSVKYIREIPDCYGDIIISTHALEHTVNPFGVLQELRNKLKNNGKMVFVVPNESCNTEYFKSDINNHLYTWNCLTLGNLFKAAGFFINSVERIQTLWPKHYLEIEKEVSRELFEAICLINGKAFEENVCVIVASK